MIDHIFGKEENTIEVCSGSIKGRIATSSSLGGNESSLSSILQLPSSSFSSCFMVDINPDLNPDCVGDAQLLKGIANRIYSRWMGDPPYNHRNAKKKYGTKLPSPIRLPEAGARVCKPGSLM
ncbi:MAG: hypothetical protein WBP64_06715, partial [Nitrososphaeraceae archaeon]